MRDSAFAESDNDANQHIALALVRNGGLYGNTLFEIVSTVGFYLILSRSHKPQNYLADLLEASTHLFGHFRESDFPGRVTELEAQAVWLSSVLHTEQLCRLDCLTTQIETLRDLSLRNFLLSLSAYCIDNQFHTDHYPDRADTRGILGCHFEIMSQMATGEINVSEGISVNLPYGIALEIGVWLNDYHEVCMPAKIEAREVIKTLKT